MFKDFNTFNILKLNSETDDVTECNQLALDKYKKITKKVPLVEQMKKEKEKELKKIEKQNNPQPQPIPQSKPKPKPKPKPIEQKEPEKHKNKKPPKKKLPKIIKQKKLIIDFTKKKK